MTPEQIFTAVSLTIAGATAWWGFKRGKKSDAVSEQSGIATETRAGTLMVIDGLNKLVDQLQEGAATHKETTQYLQTRLDAVLAENAELKLELARLRKRYGVNGENGPTTPPAA